MQVLIVDDEPLIRWSMAETLAQVGHSVTEAHDAQEALERLSKGPTPDVILLDFRLPDSCDLRLLETIRRMVPTSRIVMMTAYGSQEVLDNAVRLGVFRVITKPVEMGELDLLVKAAFDSRLH